MPNGLFGLQDPNDQRAQLANALRVGGQPADPMLAQGWDTDYEAIADYVARQRAQSAQMGMWGPQGITPQGARAAGMSVANALALATTAPKGDVPGFTAYHGSPHDFDQFDASKIGTGEGAQAYGHGLYLADAEGVAKSYRDALSETNPTTRHYLNIWQGDRPKALAAFDKDVADNAFGFGIHPEELAAIRSQIESPRGNMYEVHVNADPQHFLDWDAPLSEQHPVVQDRLSFLRQVQQVPRNNNAGGETTGGQLVNYLTDRFGGDQSVVAQELHGEGIPGIRYLDAGSRGAGDGTKNTVVFDPSILRIVRKYAIPAAMLSGTGHGLVMGDQE